MKKILLLTVLWPSLVWAQDIQVDQLQSASPFQTGTLTSAEGGLDQSLWQGTSADLAVQLLDDINGRSYHPVARDLVRAALLSPGVPPQSTDVDIAAQFQKARIQHAISLGEMNAVRTIATRAPELASDRRLSADLALLSGDNVGACSIADGVLDGRSDAEWASLRAFCHITRGEIAAAELTTDLLRSDGYKDPVFYSLIQKLSGAPGTPNLKDLANDPLHIAMMSEADLSWPKGKRPVASFAQDALNENTAPSARLEALFAAGAGLSDTQITQILESLGRSTNEDGLAGGTVLSYDDAIAAPPPVAIGRLYDVARFGSSGIREQAIYEILHRANIGGGFDRFAAFLAPLLEPVPAQTQWEINSDLFLKSALKRRDLSALQQIYNILGDKDPGLQARIALAADAMGNGFFGGTPGIDIEDRIAKSGAVQKRAIRDAYLAFALGANLSDDVVMALQSQPVLRRRFDPRIIGLQSAARKQARGEAALWAAQILRDGPEKLDDLTLFHVISGLHSAGLYDQAGQIAAIDFLGGPHQ